MNQNRFDRWSHNYHEGRIHKWFRFRQQLVVEQMDLNDGGAVLDIGCGTGWCVLNLTERFPRSKSFGLDLSYGMLVKARGELTSSYGNPFVLGDAESLPFSSQAFEYVVCTSSFHHYTSPKTALLEFKRILKPTGKLIIVESCRCGSFGVCLWDRWLRIFEEGHVKYYTREELFLLFKQAGYKEVGIPFAQAGVLLHGKLFDSTVVITGRPEKFKKFEDN
ncbi:MAG: class I SAM-dependent methyltransferase [Nitrospirae bacterium]|nr:class I SAM-dependent methyltransferase [Nitrospirota bacterium]